MKVTEVGKAISLEEVLDVFLAEGLASGGSFALWRKPNSSQLSFIQDFSQSPRRVSLQLEELPSGFVVQPFADQEDKKAFFIQGDRYEKLSLESPLNQEDMPQWMQASRDSLPTAELKKQIAAHLSKLPRQEFNVVGQGGANQIAESMNRQAQTPIQAYVLAQNVTTAQSLNRNIVSNASLG